MQYQAKHWSNSMWKLTAILDRLKVLWALPDCHNQLRQYCDELERRLKALESAQEIVEKVRKSEEREQITKLRNSTPHQRVQWLEATDGGRNLG